MSRPSDSEEIMDRLVILEDKIEEVGTTLTEILEKLTTLRNTPDSLLATAPEVPE